MNIIKDKETGLLICPVSDSCKKIVNGGKCPHSVPHKTMGGYCKLSNCLVGNTNEAVCVEVLV